jgi:glycine reductase
MKKAIHYINQFFAGIGGEEKADHAPEIREGLVGPAMALNAALDAEVTHTVICGDNFMGSHTDEAIEQIIGFLQDKEFDIFVAGPAFRAGRYGVACGHICKAVKKHFGVPVLTSMNDENPGVDMFKKDMPIFIGGKSAAKMRADVKKMSKYGNKILAGEPTLGAEAEGYFVRGVRQQVWLQGAEAIPAAQRGVEMLLKKLAGEPYQTELVIPKVDMVPIAPPVQDLSKAKIALVTSGGIVPVDNPDRIQSASATRWGKYDISMLDRLPAAGDDCPQSSPHKAYKTIHAGYDPAAADADPNVCVPLDALRAYQKEGKIGAIATHFYSTVGTGTTQAEAAKMGTEIVEHLRQDGVDAVIMTST